MTVHYAHRQFEMFSVSQNKMDEEQYKITEDIAFRDEICTYCRQTIVDKYYYKVDGLTWHSYCLRCYACQSNLSGMQTCFRKNDKLWCKQDYNRQFRCQKCIELLKPSDLVMRLCPDSQPYHVGCFRCEACNVLLLSGDYCGYSDNQVLCKSDFLTRKRAEMARHESETPTCSIEENLRVPIVSSIDDNVINKVQSPKHECIDFKGVFSINEISESHNEDVNYAITNSIVEDGSTEKEYAQLTIIISDSTKNYEDQKILSEHVQEKPLVDIQEKFEKTSSPMSNNDQNINEVTDSNELSSSTDLGKEATDHNSIQEVSIFGTEDDDITDSSCSGDTEDRMTVSGNQSVLKKASNNLRQKRIRTSFKHQQLRTMKTYFAMNHNPDSKDLRQLSQKTGLSKRVLQVWFQNARAKFRRSLCRQSGIMCPPSSNPMQISNKFDDSMLLIDKNENYSNKVKMTAFNDISSSLLNHSIATNHPLYNMSDMVYSNSTNTISMLSSLSNLSDRYLPNGKQFIPTSSFYSQ